MVWLPVIITTFESSTSIVFPDLVKPEPAVINPAPLNCVYSKLVVPTVIEPSVDKTHPVSPLIVPSSTNVKAPAVTSELLS